MAQTTIQIHLYHDGPTAGMLDCWVTPPDGATQSFDPAQLPKEFDGLLGDLLPAALASKVDAESKAAALQAENEAKDANIQTVMGENEALKTKMAALEARIAELAVFEAMAG